MDVILADMQGVFIQQFWQHVEFKLGEFQEDSQTNFWECCYMATRIMESEKCILISLYYKADGLGNCAKSWWLLYFKEAQNRAPVNLKIVKFVEEQ